MEMRAGGMSGRADDADLLADCDLLSLGDGRSGQMRIKRIQTVAVAENDKVAVSAVASAVIVLAEVMGAAGSDADDRAGGSCTCSSAVDRAAGADDVNAAVMRAPARTEAAGDAVVSGGRPCELSAAVICLCGSRCSRCGRRRRCGGRCDGGNGRRSLCCRRRCCYDRILCGSSGCNSLDRKSVV